MSNECAFTTYHSLMLLYTILLPWLGVQSSPAEVCVVVEEPSQADEGMHIYVFIHSHFTTVYS